MKIPADLLARPAEEAVRRLALVQLERAAAARSQLVEGDREEALHDFRVALRRLRSLLRSHRSVFAVEFPKKVLRRLAALARDTNPGRDAEVQLAWLATFTDELKPNERAGHGEIVRELAERRDESYRKVEREIVRDFAAIAEDLGSRLINYRVSVDLERPSRPPNFAAATRDALGRGGEELFENLTRIESAADEAAGHAARIAAKRLRYLIEPVAPWIEVASRPVEVLRALQDLLGELHDGQLLAAQVAHALAEIESKRAQILIAATLDESAGSPQTATPVRRRERGGLIAIARRLGARRSELFKNLAQNWLGDDSPLRLELRAALEALDTELGTRPGRRLASGGRRPLPARRTPSRLPS